MESAVAKTTSFPAAPLFTSSVTLIETRVLSAGTATVETAVMRLARVPSGDQADEIVPASFSQSAQVRWSLVRTYFRARPKPSVGRSEERRGGEVCVRKWGSRWAADT